VHVTVAVVVVVVVAVMVVMMVMEVVAAVRGDVVQMVLLGMKDGGAIFCVERFVIHGHGGCSGGRYSRRRGGGD